MTKTTQVRQLPDVDSLNGIGVLDNGTGRMDDIIEIQYTNATQGDFSLHLRAGDAMYLLNLLSALQRDCGYQNQPAG